MEASGWCQRVNYAATLAVLAVLAFFFPLAVRVASYFQVPQGLSVSTLSTLGVLVIAVMLIRWRVNWSRSLMARADQGRAQVAAQPLSPGAYSVEGEHLALTLLKLGRRREAAELIDRFARAPGVQQAEVQVLRARLAAQLGRARREAEVRGAPPGDAR